uniref:SFR19-like C-terminal domain-containing protein n=1 Tax=Sphenodon punctatus TaxID=8508 RepID=A0A8D0GHE1_SPHPU
MSSLLDETIDAVAAGLSTAVYQRPLTPRVTSKRKRKKGRKKRTRTKSSVGKENSGSRFKRSKRRVKKRRVKKIRIKNEVTTRSRIAKTLGLGKPVRGASVPSVYKPVEPSLGLMRADIGAASLSVFGDPYELDPYESNEELPPTPASPLSIKRRALSQSALRSHQPVARTISVGLSRRSVPALIPEQETESAPVPDLLGSILSGQSLLLMSSSDVVINRDGSLTAKKAGTTASSSRAEPSRSSQPDPHTKPTSSNLLSLSLSSLSQVEKAGSFVPTSSGRAAIRLEYSMTPRSVKTQNLANLSRLGPKSGEMPRFNGGSKCTVSSLATSSKPLGSNSSLFSKNVPVRQPLKLAPKRIDISELPRIPKIKKDANFGHLEAESVGNRSGDIPSSCVTKLTGKGSTSQPVRGSKMESSKPNDKESQRPMHTSRGFYNTNTGVCGSTALPGTSRGKGGSSPFASFKINIPGNVGGHPSRLSNPGFCNTFRPVDEKVQQKENPSPLFSLKKPKPIKSEIYDPFDPTGSDSSSTNSSPERMPFTNITRTISIDSPKVQTFQTVRRFTPYTMENIFGSGAESSDVLSSNTESHDDVKMEGRIVEQISDTEQEKMDEEDSSRSPCTSTVVRRISKIEHLNEESRESPCSFFEDEDPARLNVKMEPDSPLINNDQQKMHKKDKAAKRSLSRSPSISSSRGRKKSKRKKASLKEHKRTRSRSRSTSRSSRSTSWSAEEDYSKTHKPKSKTRHSSSDYSSSHERLKKKKAKDKNKDKKAKSSWSRDRKRSRSRSGSAGSSLELYESRKKKRQSGSKSRGRDRSRSNSTERVKKRKHRRDKSYERYDKKDSFSRSRERKRSRSRSRERRKWRLRSPSVTRSREHKGIKSREKRPRSRSRSKERKYKPKEMSPLPPQEKDPRSSDENITRSVVCSPPLKQEPEDAVLEDASSNIHLDIKLEKETPRESAVAEVDFQKPVQMEQISEEFTSKAVLPKPECTTSQALAEENSLPLEEEFTVGAPIPALSSQTNVSLEEIIVKKEDGGECSPLIDSLLEKEIGVYSQNIPLTPPMPSSLPPYAPVSQPTVQFIMQGSLPLLDCVAGPSLTPEPGSLATASEPGIQAASTGDAEEEIKAPKSPVDKTKNEEYMKKLHMQERAVEEVKLAIKPFYQKREITKEEYKDILRKAVQKICHSKSGEINPVKVANLVKAYVEKYKHMRKHKKSETEEAPQDMEN